MLLKLANLILTLYLLVAISMFSWLHYEAWSKAWDAEAQRLKFQQEEKQELIELTNSIRVLEAKIDTLLPRAKKK